MTYATNRQEGKAMQEQITPQQDEKAAVSEFRVRLGEATELTQGSGSGTSEDKRYLYN